MNDELLKRAGINVNVVSDEQAEEVFNENSNNEDNPIEFSVISDKNKFKDLISIYDKDVQDTLIYLHNIEQKGGVSTDIKRVDEDYDSEDIEYEQHKVYEPKYLIETYYADNTEPKIEEYDKIEDAVSNIDDFGNIYGFDVSDYYEPYNELHVIFRSYWADKEGDEIEEIDDGLTVEDIDDYEFDKLSYYDESIIEVFAPAKINEIEEYQSNVENSLEELIEGYEGELDGKVISLEIPRGGLGKYNRISVVDKEGDEMGVIQLRIADHSYNPSNNDSSALEGNFISVVLSDNDPTANKFNGRYNLSYKIGDEINKILFDVQGRIDEIIEDWNDSDRRSRFSIQSVNDKFNKELLSINEKNADSKYLSLGMPNDILQSTGIQNKELKLYGNKIIKKAKKHGFKISDLTNLPKSISKPIAIFSGAIENSHAVLTELKIDNKNVLVSISIGKNNDIDFNIVSSVYGKDVKGVLDWINKEKMLYTNKNKTLDYLRISAPIADAQNNQEFDVAAKLIQNFENPPINGEKISTNAEKLSTSGGLIYGYTQNGEIYLTERGLNPNTPVHEYTHLWAAAMMKKTDSCFL